MKRKILFALVIALALAMAGAAWAQPGDQPKPDTDRMMMDRDRMMDRDMGPMDTEGLPVLRNGTSLFFPADSMDDAQKVCDRVATKNNRERCTAYEERSTGGTTAYYCICN